MAERWVRVAESEELRGAGPFGFSPGGKEVVLVRAGGKLRAFEGRCPHRSALLGEGEIEDGKLVCRNHRWRFDVETGKHEGGPECLRACPVRETAGETGRETGRVVEVDVAALPEEARKKATRKITDLPGPRPLPLVGSAHLLDRTALHATIEGWARTYGTPFTYKFGKTDVLVVSDPEAMNPVFRDRPDGFRRLGALEPVSRELGVLGVFAAEGEAWRPQRRLSMEALAHRHLRGFYPTLRTVAERLRNRWMRAAREQRALDLTEELKRFTVDVTTELVFGYDINTLEREDNVIQDKLGLILPAFTRRLLSIVPWWRIFKMPRDHALDRAIAELKDWLRGLVAEARARLAKDPVRAQNPTNFLEAMVLAKDDEGRPFDDMTVFGNCITMLLAGEDTTAYTIAWSVHHLLDAPAEVRKVQAEVDALVPPEGVPSDVDAVNKLTYVGAVASEAMRLRSVAPLLYVQAKRDTVVQDIEVPRGSQVALLIRAAANDPKAFRDPDRFLPSRWVEEGEGPHDPSALQPFGSGPRICPGRALALLEMKLVLGTLYRSFEVTRVGASEDVEERLHFTMHPSELSVRMTARAPAS